MKHDMTDEEKAAMGDVMRQVSEATKRIIGVTTPTSYDEMLANVVALRFLAHTAFEMLDEEGKMMASVVGALQAVAMAETLARVKGETSEAH